jgi:hypothetical protein
MLVCDLVIDGKGLFHYMNELETLPFTPAMDIDTMDKMFIGLHGMKVVSPTVASIMLNGGITEENMLTVAKMLLTMYSTAWSRLYELYTQDIPLESYSMTTTETHLGTEETSIGITSESTSQDRDRVSGYNASDMVDNVEKTTDRQDTTTNQGSRTDERTITKEVRGLQGSRVQEVTRLSKFIQNNLIIDVVFNNVANFVGSLYY